MNKKLNKSKNELIDRETLRFMYVDLNLSVDEIAKQLNSTRLTVSKWLRRYDIRTRKVILTK